MESGIPEEYGNCGSRKNIIKRAYSAVLSLNKPEHGTDFIKGIYKDITGRGRKEGFEVPEKIPFQGIEFYEPEQKNENAKEQSTCLAVHIEVQFGGPNECYRTIRILENSQAAVCVYITSSKSRGLPIPKIINIFSGNRKENNKGKTYIVLDIETGQHMFTGIDWHDQKIMYHRISPFSAPEYHKNSKKQEQTEKIQVENETHKKRRKMIYGR